MSRPSPATDPDSATDVTEAPTTAPEPEHDSRGTKAIIAAFCANLGIAAAKFVGFVFTGSGSMLAEGVHSLVDTGDQALLMLGGRRARKQADEQHPFGYGRERFFWAFMVAVVLFTLGGAFAITDGVEKILHPHELDKIWWAVVILVVAMVLESLSFRTALREARKQRGGQVRLWRYIRNAKAPEVPVVLLEDGAALLGLAFALAAVLASHFTGDARWDGYGTVAIGALLGTVAVVLATEMKSLLIGESASPNQREAIAAALDIEPSVVRVIHLRTEHLGPEELLVGAKVEFLHDLTLPEVAEAVNRVEANVRANVPEARVMYIEPDVSRDRLPPPLVPEHTGTSPDDPTPPPRRAPADEDVLLAQRLTMQRRSALADAAQAGSADVDPTVTDVEPPHPTNVASVEAPEAPATGSTPDEEDPARRAERSDDTDRDAPSVGGRSAWPAPAHPGANLAPDPGLDELLRPQEMPSTGTGARRRRRQADEPTRSVPRIEPPDVPDS